MPLNTEVTRNGKIRKDISWNYPELSCMLTVAIKEGAPDYEYAKGKPYSSVPDGKYVDFSMAPIYYMEVPCDLWEKGEQVVKEDHEFDLYTDENEKPLVFKKGDVLKMWRSYKS